MAGLFASFKQWSALVFDPPYQLTLSDKIVDKLTNKSLYVFKQYGSHDFVKITYVDIVNNKSLIQAINPVNLMDIHLNEYLSKIESNEHQVVEYLRGDKYKISNGNFEEVYSGESICKNIDMFRGMSVGDVCKIAYASGFTKGRKVSSEIKVAVERAVAEIEGKDFHDHRNVVKIKK